MHELTRIALVGTSKQASDAVDADHPVEALVGKLAVPDREQSILFRAGARAVFALCGQLAGNDTPPLSPCPGEQLPVAPQQLLGPLQNAMASDSWDLFVEFLRQLRATGWLLPPELLPQALSVSDATVREELLPVLGERGRWLSSFNPEWRWVTAGIGELSGRDRDALLRQWDEGTVAERFQALRTMRGSDPAEARQWLVDVIDKEKAEHRVRLLSAMEIGLTPDDVSTLESRLDDRSELVRRVAAGLLALLPDSPLTHRMRQRASEMLKAEATGMLRKKLKLTCTPPEAIDKSWERDGVPKKAPAGRGKRAVWTETVMRAVPPSIWVERFQTPADRLVDAILDDDFAVPVLVGWTLAAAAFASIDPDSAAWLEPLWNHWVLVEKRTRGEKGQRAVLEHLKTLLRSMPQPDAALLPILKGSVADANAEQLGLLSLLPRPWSEAFGAAYLSTVRDVVRRYADNRAYQWAGTLLAAGRALPRETFTAALETWQLANADSGNWHSQAVLREIDKFKDTIQTRKSFYDEVSSAANG